ncbi:hypothetical protein ACO2Q8_25955 [Larkinella sp. VNQ87]|uniref:hypothetical protein n=1 Tax=Larkinella sp. VNQ87 TaxID=3400921 RepID=UPI003BFD1D6F
MERSNNLIAEPDQQTVDLCHTENQRWARTLTNYQQEIDQLLTLLDDVLERYTQQNLRPRAIEYQQHLHRLQAWFKRFRSDLICERADCPPGSQQICRELQFGRHTTIAAQLADLSADFSRTKMGCYQFLSILVQLNLL